jgi:hypothetical protein
VEQKCTLGTIPIPFVEQAHVFPTRHAHPIGWQATNLTWSCIRLLDNSVEVLLGMFHRYADSLLAFSNNFGISRYGARGRGAGLIPLFGGKQKVSLDNNILSVIVSTYSKYVSNSILP